jgi:WD40 repeat protein
MIPHRFTGIHRKIDANMGWESYEAGWCFRRRTESHSYRGGSMNAAVWMHVVRVVSLMFLGAVSPSASLNIVGTMHDLRASHSATRLPDGKVLIAGGFYKVHVYEQKYCSSAELYEPSSGSFVPTGSLHFARMGHTATLLNDGRVLIAGGGSGSPLRSTELYDGSTGRFVRGPDMTIAREGHTATRLPDGTVLIVGGTSDLGHSAEVFDPAANVCETVGSLQVSRIAHTATLLPNGRVLVVGGTDRVGPGRTVFASAELYDPQLRKFLPTGSMHLPRYKHGAIRLPSGNVLVVGGSDAHDWNGEYSSAELYDWRLGTFHELPGLNAARFKLPHGLALLPDGSVLVSGGSTVVERFDPATRRFSVVEHFLRPHYYQVATSLADGSVLLTGGYDRVPQSTASVWRYVP